MNKAKKRFIDKLKKQSKNQLVDIICDLYEERFHMAKEIKRVKHVCFSHEIVLKSVLSHVSPIDIDIDDDETDEITTEDKETLRSYV
jgi:hypothetical protein